ncbi:hydroxymethylglutaryl-CoA lyase [Thalassobaculum sp. OXR-137]|uniref:hydroxymethylglutaryl-CoA lyase n=1 Tax=Thalassobaculum sp. OXR-137 TaxID=3100173 RepID=UPI002AC99777|nr:hydroxymethylglutaryl-CoA lyase [Thalassobaculum sp. OXR-137]WPZ34763.1 hydroxymethylglutaryl-CoA lyase [Thalassobaculum sp. OXR-137]
MTQVRKVEVTDVGPRDGLQAEKRLIPAAEKIALINRLIDAGVPRIEATSFVSPKAVPQLADAAEVMAGIDRSKGAIIATLVPNARGAIRAAECQVDEMVVFVSASESHNKKNVNRSVEDSLKGFEEVAKIAGDAKIPVHGAIATAFGCPFEGNVAPERLAMIAKRFQDMGFVGMTFGDTTGMATPPTVRAGIAAVREAAPKLTMGLHFHNTRGIGLANVMVGLDEGIDKYESSFGGTGGCPFAPGATGNICTEDLVYLLHEMGIETGIDLRKLMAIGCDVETVVGHPLPGQVMKAGQRLDLHDMDAVRTAEG